MKCEDIRNATYVYLDGEFAPPEEAAFERHLEGCLGCRTTLEAERSFLEAFRTELKPQPAPQSLRDAVARGLRQTPIATKPAAPTDSRMWLPLAAAACAAALVVLVVDSSQSATDPVADEAIAAHQSALPMEAQGSREQIKRFLQAHVPFAVQVPFDGEPEIRLIGARLTRYNGRHAVLFNFDAKGERISVLQVASGDSDMANDAISEHRQGYKVVTFRHRGLTNSVVGNLAPAAFDRVRSTMTPATKRAALRH